MQYIETKRERERDKDDKTRRYALQKSQRVSEIN